MAIQIKDLSGSVRTVRVDFQGDHCAVQYRAGENTAQAAIELQERMEDEDANATELMVERLSTLLASWDLMDGDKTVPITKKVLLQLPIPFLSAILTAIAEDQNPPKRKSRR